ncbi:Mov34/MPN/PAD-1 family protein [Methanobrevibacter sp. DSM 116169]|uniref:Mov34/MPN/PAD-1 family protein n=1 Tax=Methanobrevibacter sp. DSM 116169 TaxID=3242727 RepID=UPI0038FC9321
MGFFSKIFKNNNKKFNEVKVDREVIESFLFYANESYPREFLALLEGQIKDEILYITGLIFLPGETSDTGAVLQTGLLPPTMNYWGSIHSHPGPSARPSGADLSTFSKLGVFHMIVCLPYSFETIIAYNKRGEEVPLNIGDYKYLFEKELKEDFDGDFFDEEDFDNDFEDELEENEIIPQKENNIPLNQIVIDPDDLNDGVININIEVDEKGNVKKINKKRK